MRSSRTRLQWPRPVALARPVAPLSRARRRRVRGSSQAAPRASAGTASRASPCSSSCSGCSSSTSGPARSYWSTVQEAKHRRADVARLKHENTKLRARRDALRNPAALEREARRLGMVRPGERSYVVKHLPKGP